jgi:arsenite-transporting ATPase
MPETITDHYFDYWKANQEYYYHTIEECFAPLPVLTIPLMEREVVGFDMLRAMAHALYHDQDPTKFFYHGKTHHIEKQNSHYTLSFELPYTTRDEISLVRNGDELIINVGTYRRNIILPRTLVNLPVVGARFDNDKLVIRFGEEPGRENRQTL